MNNIKVRTKLVIVMVIALIALALCAVISNTSLSGLGNNALDIIENDMRSSYDEQIKAQVDNVISLCQSIYNRYEKGEYTLDEAEKLAADQIRDLRYGNNGYFWVDTYDGTNVVLLGNDTEGTNRMDAVDTNGFAYMQAIISAGRQENGGFTDYVFPREGETEPSPKRAYSKAFEPFGWKVDMVLSHTTPLKYEPVEVFMSGVDQSRVDKSTEEWLNQIPERLPGRRARIQAADAETAGF